MTTVTGLGQGHPLSFEWELEGLIGASVTSSSSTTVVLASTAGETVTLTGSFTSFSGGRPTAGIITGLSVGETGQPLYLTATGMTLAVGAFWAFVNSNNGAGLVATILAGDDTITGSGLPDELMGGTGNDILDGGAGFDRVTYRNATSGVTVSLAGGSQNTGPDGTDTLISIEQLEGSAYDDILTAGPTNGWLLGGEGADILRSGSANDILDGGGGIDTADYSAASQGVGISLSNGTGTAIVGQPGGEQDMLVGIENLEGSAYNDVLSATLGDNILRGNGGDDRLAGGAGNDTLDGGAGEDTADYSNNTVGGATAGVTVNLTLSGAQNTGGAGVDTLASIENIRGSQFNDVLTGDNAANKLWGEAGADTLYGGQGDDILDGGLGNDILDGGAGIDTASFATSTSYANGLGVTVNLSLTGAQNTGQGYLDTLISIENLIGSNWSDVLIGNAANNILRGNGGGDVLNGGLGDDILDGTIPVPYYGLSTASYSDASQGVTVDLHLAGVAQNTGVTGWDTLININNLEGSAFNDILVGDSNQNTLSGLGGDDLLSGGQGVNFFDGGAGIDIVSYADAVIAVTASLAVATMQNTTQNTSGGEYRADTFISIEGLIGSNFNDQLTGDSGANIFTGGLGNDRINGGAGQDTAVFSGARANYTVNIDEFFVVTVTGADGTDTLTSVESLRFSDQTVSLWTAVDGTPGVDTLSGTSGADIISGLGANDILSGLTGDDYLLGGEGDDLLIGGLGNDILDGSYGVDTASYADAASAVTVNLASTAVQNTAGAGSDKLIEIDNLIGSAFNDTLSGNTGANIFTGGAGNDTIDGKTGDDIAVFSGASTDYVITRVNATTYTVAGADGTDTLVSVESLRFTDRTISIAPPITGGTSADSLVGTSAGDTISGLQGDDTLIGQDGDDSLFGDENNDLLFGGAGNDLLDGGTGTDTVSYAGTTAPVTVSLQVSGPQNTGGAGIDTLVAIENLIGGDGADWLIGDAGANQLNGWGASDILEGGGGNDSLYGGGGGDDIASYAHAGNGVNISLAITTPQDAGSDGFDTFSGIWGLMGSAFNDVLTGDSNQNKLIGGLGDDVLNGGGGEDTASYITATVGVTVSLGVSGLQNTGAAGYDTLNSIENLEGSNFGDVLTGGAGEGVLLGRNGDDILVAGTGRLYFDGGLGSDTVDYHAHTASVNVSLYGGSYQVSRSYFTDYLVSIENLIGTAFNDYLQGDDGDNVIEGGLGDDGLQGGLGNDTASYEHATSAVTISLTNNPSTGRQVTGAGNDSINGFENLRGSAFNDSITGDAGANILTGLAGDDTIVANAGNDSLFGGTGSDALYGQAGADILDDGDHTGLRDYLYGGAGNDTYYVTSAYTDANEDLVYEGGTNPDLMAGVGDMDTIVSRGDFFWDFYSVGEVLRIGTDAGSLLVGGKDVMTKTITGGAGNDRIVTYGHNSIVDAGAGADGIDFGAYDLGASYNGSNTLVMKPGTGLDYVYNFESGVDHIDLSAFHFGITGQDVLNQAVNVDNAGTANDYCYFYLTGAGGTDNFITFMGLLSSQLRASDFIM